jgi:hypothetical protein
VIQYQAPQRETPPSASYTSVWRHTPVPATSRSRTLARSGHSVCSPRERVVSHGFTTPPSHNSTYIEPECSSPTSQNYQCTKYTVSQTNLAGLVPCMSLHAVVLSLLRVDWWMANKIMVEHVAFILRVYSTLLLYQHKSNIDQKLHY